MATCSSFHGVIDEIPGISVDNFENPERVRARAYFLSHCHTDHTKGLHAPELLKTLEQTGAFIYMSANTAAVINDEKTDERLMRYVKPLRLGTHSITLPSVPEQNLDYLYLDLILIPAGHSFGSVMFIFKMADKNVMFTGDFRISPNDIPKYNHLHENGDALKLDTLYVDTTFISLRYTNFPKRTTSIEEALEEITEWLRKSETNYVALHSSAKYGYECVFNQVHDTLNMKVYVGADRWRFYGNLPDLIPGVTNQEKSTKIHLCRNRSENQNHYKCISDSQDKQFLYVHFSAMKWGDMNSEFTCNRVSKHRLDVCFSTHCSRNELKYFVKYFNPKKVVGFPNEYEPNTPRRKDEVVFEVTPKKMRVVSPKVLKSKDQKVDKTVLRKIFEL